MNSPHCSFRFSFQAVVFGVGFFVNEAARPNGTAEPAGTGTPTGPEKPTAPAGRTTKERGTKPAFLVLSEPCVRGANSISSAGREGPAVLAVPGEQRRQPGGDGRRCWPGLLCWPGWPGLALTSRRSIIGHERSRPTPTTAKARLARLARLATGRAGRAGGEGTAGTAGTVGRAGRAGRAGVEPLTCPATLPPTRPYGSVW